MAAQTEDKKLNGAGLTTLWGIIKQFFSSKQDKVSPLGSATKPVYISGDGTFGECDSYKDSTVKNIVGEFSDTNAEFAYRPSAGAVDIESGKADYGGHLEVIKGNTVAWNQMIQNGDFSDGTNGWSIGGGILSTSITNNVLTCINKTSGYTNKQIVSDNMFAISGHKYYYRLLAASSQSREFSIQFGTYNIDKFQTSSSLSIFKGIIDCSNSEYTIIKFFGDYGEEGETYSVSKIQTIDLTLIYGAGNEPTTVEQFEADYQKWFGKPLTYEDYDAGSLKPVKMAGIKTVGFNLWDEEWENAYLNADGTTTPYSGIIMSKSFIPVIAGEQYYYNYSITGGRICYYDSNKNFVSTFIYNNRILTIPEGVAYMKFDCSTIYGTTYNHDICINLHHSGDKDGQYEPYWESTLNVPITSLKGKLNGQGSSVVVFPDGMKKAGTVYDEIVRRGDKTYAIKRVGSVDLGTLTWQYQKTSSESNYRFLSTSTITPTPKGYTGTVMVNALCALYSTTTPSDTYFHTNNNIMSIDTEAHLCIVNDTYSEATGFKTAMSGIILFYELETPQEYLLDDFELPQNYDVDDWGTEEVLLGENGCAPVLDLKYGINAGDTIKNLPHNYVSAVGEQQFTEAQKERARQNIGAASEEDMIRVKKQLEAIVPKVDNDYFVDMGLPSGILWAKRNIDLSQPNGFAASEYQYEGSFFSWGNVDGHNPTSTSSFGEYSFGTGNDTEPYVSSDGAALTGDITPSFDAAHVNLGSPWRMPTEDDFAELFNSAYTKFIDASGNDIAPSTTNKLITMNGVVGIRLKSIVNGNIIFFPCSGGGDGSSLNSRGSNGYYWSASLNSATNGRSLSFHAGGVYPQDDYYRRYLGFAVRPVM